MLATSPLAVGEQLRADAFCHTSWAELGLDYDEAQVANVLDTVTEKLWTPPDDSLQREARANSKACLQAARTLMQPIVDRLFVKESQDYARRKWELFGVNYYERGNVFPPHRDFNGSDVKTVIIASLSGVRSLSLEGRSPLRLEPRSIVLLDGVADLEHSASCLEGPSVSVVADIPELLYD